MEPDYDALAKAHMRSQVTHAATVQAALSRLWEETIDPSDLGRSFLDFRSKAVTYINAGRTISNRTADTYLAAIKDAAGLSAPVLGNAETRLPTGRIESSLTAATGKALARAEALQRRGLDPSAALAVALSNMLGSAKRQIINASRSRVIDSTRRDPQLDRWARVSDGAPCRFCAMLVSRGPVYSALSVHFAAHDRCGCNARPVTPDDPTGGWSPEAIRYRDAWEADQRARMRLWYESRGEEVPERYRPRPGEESFVTITDRRKTDHATAPDHRSRQTGVSATPGSRGDAGGARGASSDGLAGRGDRRGDTDRLVVGGADVTPIRTVPKPPRLSDLEVNGVPTVDLIELDPATSADAFRRALASAKESVGKHGSSVTLYDDYRDMRLFVTPDGLSGFALTADGDIISVFSHADQPVRGVARSLLAYAVSQGGNRLDAFETYLPKVYAREGFRPVARLAFDDEYAPDGWDYDAYAQWNNGRPDVIFFVYDPERIGSTYDPSEAVRVATYEEGQARQTL
ncbi:VG15 protein [Microbacterium sp. XT11]|uniref:VG15 protein n=1 Tax=Microbacterium sp. XT11 TaxID=367477 RepID=UPI000742D9EB|nr:hypothetical protein [Microbacterium sp. XT11]ALX67274.1 hypothetical protein AB663_003100 [Microbacterium sp. XT11]